MPERAERLPMHVGDRFVIDVGTIAHGGHCIAHHGGRTLLVRHALPGERVEVVVTEVASKVCRADAVTVLVAAPDRVVPPCPQAGPGRCGGCDFQHVALAAQRELKAHVVSDALARFAGIHDLPVVVEPVPGSDDGLHWRTRTTWHVDLAGRIGFFAARTHRVVPVDDCLIATEAINEWRTRPGDLRGSRAVHIVEDSDRRASVHVDGIRQEGESRIHQRVLDRVWTLSPTGFWQVHCGAPQTLVHAALSMASPEPGETWWDLYSGAGLFSAFLGMAVGPAGDVQAIEGHEGSARDARRNLRDLPQIHVSHADVRTWVRGRHGPIDGVLLDPPRTGAGIDVVDAIVAAGPARIVYVACDPVSLARDIRAFAEHGYRLRTLRAFDAFPMTHHVECVAELAGH